MRYSLFRLRTVLQMATPDSDDPVLGEKWSDTDMNNSLGPYIDHRRVKYPFCIVWTPIPVLTWLFPVIGHMGIAMSSGVIRDFAGPYFVSEDNMAFGKPTKYWVLDPSLSLGGQAGWDRSVSEASEEYKNRMHNLFCDNCHSHVAMALNQMHYDNSTSWNMIRLWFLMLLHGRYVSIWGWLKTWLPFFIVAGLIIMIYLVTNYQL